MREGAPIVPRLNFSGDCFMIPTPRRLAVALAVLTGLCVVAPAAQAQAYNYPSMQTPRASQRDYSAAIVGGSGTTLLFQWREGAGSGMHWQLDAGLADPRGSTDPLLFVGGSFAREMLRATTDQPLDVLFTVGAGAAIGGDASAFRIPVGASLGHTFELDQGMAITPYVHPRVSLDFCGDCGARDNGRSSLSLNFDLGADFQATKNFGVRVAASFSGSDVVGSDETFAIGFRWTPVPLGRR